MNRLIFIFLFTLPALSACSVEQDSTDSATTTASGNTATVEQLNNDAMASNSVSSSGQIENFDTAYSVRTLMNAIVQPNATQLWQAVRYVVSADGVEEDVSPRTEEDWAKLRTSAITLVETGNALLLPGRAIDNTRPAPNPPAYQYRPEEIQALLEAEPDTWRYYVQEMQFSTQATLEAIEKRDVLGLIETGAAINNACEGCHGEFWYRRDIL